jgi:ribonuclease G
LPPAAAEEAPAEDRGTDQESRDRRSRRSRRRRNRGRGFPESKYVSAAPSEPAADIQVLPGESLAKYHPETAGEPEDSPFEPEQTEPLPDVAAEDRNISEAEPEAEFLPESEVVLDPEPEPEEAPVPELPLPPEPAAEFEAAPISSEEPLAQTEDRTLAATEPGEVPEPAAEIQEAPAADPEASEPASEATANVREPSPRYPHRLSRRLRRKVHGAGEGSELRAPHHEHPDRAAKPEGEEARPAAAEKPAPSISDLLREGQEILVQIAKEPLGQKGARITSHIALPGRYVVYMPTVDHLGVSRKVASEEERMRLRRILHTHRTGMSGGFIVRTAGEGKPEREIAADMMFLYNLWLDLRQKAEKRPAPAMVHHDLDIVQRLLRDQLATDFKAIWVDSEEVYESVLRFVERLQPDLVPRVKLYTRAVPVFDAFNITAELEKALRPKVWLKSGGYIVVNQTEALVAIDVNTGKFVGKSNRLEDTIVKTNTEAIREIVRQVRLRDLGGIIVVDFIDMDERKNRQKVMQVLEEEMQRDRAPYKILQFNDFGLVAITRKRVKQSLERTLCAPCPYCEGAGYVKSVQTVVSEILQEAVKIAKAVEGPNVVLRVHPEVAKLLKSTDNDYLEELEEVLGRPVLVTGDAALHPEKWDMA